MNSDRPTDPEASPIQFPPPARVPDSLMASTRAASTEPAPDPIAEQVLAKLGPSIENIYSKLEELLRLREIDSVRLRAIDSGVGSAHTRVGLLEDEVAKLGITLRDVANGTIAISKDINDLRDGIANQSTHDKARLATGELLTDGISERVDQNTVRIERLEAASK
jgi:hypothetical protein